MSIRRKFWVRYLPKFKQTETTFTEGSKPKGFNWVEVKIDKCCNVVAPIETIVTDVVEDGGTGCTCTFILFAFGSEIGDGVELVSPFTLADVVEALNTEYEGFATFEASGTSSIKTTFNIGGVDDLEIQSDCTGCA